MIKRNKLDKKTHADQNEFLKSVPGKAMKCGYILPSLHTTTKSIPKTGTLETAPTKALEALIRKVVTPESSLDNALVVETWEDKLGMSSTELKKNLLMCGLEESKESLLPIWLTAIAENGMTDNTRNNVITKQLDEIICDDTEVPITATLLQMIHKRKWMANNSRSIFKTPL